MGVTLHRAVINHGSRVEPFAVHNLRNRFFTSQNRLNSSNTAINFFHRRVLSFANLFSARNKVDYPVYVVENIKLQT